MIIWGWRNRRKQVSEGWFHCPRCETHREYVVEKWVRWFTLYFVPIIPTGRESAEEVVCSECMSRFDARVLATLAVVPEPEPIVADPEPVAPPAWYLDPAGSGGSRWWDGQRWTEHLLPTA